MSELQNTATDLATFREECNALQCSAGRRLTLKRPVLVFGAGQFGQTVAAILMAQGFDVVAFVESRPRTESVLGLPVLTWAALLPQHRTAQLVIGIFNREMPLDQLAALANAGECEDIFMPWDIYRQFGAELGWQYWLSAPDLILSHLDAIEQTWQSLSDDQSRLCLLNICRFRLGLKLDYGSFRHDTHQYFNELTFSALARQPVCYVDGGAYNGDTFIELTAQADVQAAWLFEPDPDNFAALAKTVRASGRAAQCLPLGLADSYQTLSFMAGKGEAGTINSNGTMHIAVVALDQLLPMQQVNLLKLDVEGAEVAALTGAANLIQRCRPVLSISLYHRAQDVWDIPQCLAGLCSDYRFYLRQHFFNSFDSVLYAVPNPM